MKKLITLLILFVGMVTSASADDDTWTLKGGFDTWGTGVPFTNGSASVILTQGQAFEFKVLKNADTWYGKNSTNITVSSYNVALNTSGGNIAFTAGAAGTYTFYLDTSNDTYPRISVKYPDCVWKLMGKLSDAEGDLTELATFSDGTASVSLTENSTYEFKIKINGGADFGNGGTMYYNDCSGWNFYSDNGNCKIKATDGGTYTFALNASGVDPNISVTYPTATYRKVYLYNNFTDPTWTQPRVYMLTHSYWDNDKGSGAYHQPDGVEMEQVGSTNVWEATYRYNASRYLCFLKDGQDGYGNFWGTEGIYRADYDNTSKIFVPNPSGNTETKNEGTVKYYKDGAWHAYPTYTRTVTEDNFGTICLPFNATVEGATVFTITSKVMDGETLKGINLTSTVDNKVEAGKAYIFKATGSTLTATLSGDYSDATAGYGMMGNISSTPVVLDGSEGYYVVGADNKIHEVVSGGSGVNVGQYKGYITLEGIGVAARGFDFISFEDGGTTAIETVKQELKANGEYYNLAGQRVAQPAKGLYIVNGKKVIMK